MQAFFIGRQENPSGKFSNWHAALPLPRLFSASPSSKRLSQGGMSPLTIFAIAMHADPRRP